MQFFLPRFTYDMWKNIQNKIDKLPWWMTNLFFIAILLFGIWMICFDESNLVTQYRKHCELSDLQEKRKFYKDQIKETDKAVAELTTNPATQEKFAREHYWMKRDNEDVFVIVPEK